MGRYVLTHEAKRICSDKVFGHLSDFACGRGVRIGNKDESLREYARVAVYRLVAGIRRISTGTFAMSDVARHG